jgi:hypothetical protein
MLKKKIFLESFSLGVRIHLGLRFWVQDKSSRISRYPVSFFEKGYLTHYLSRETK